MSSTPSLLSRLGPPVSQQQDATPSRPRSKSPRRRPPHNIRKSPQTKHAELPSLPSKPDNNLLGSAASMWATPAASEPKIVPSLPVKKAIPEPKRAISPAPVSRPVQAQSSQSSTAAPSEAAVAPSLPVKQPIPSSSRPISPPPPSQTAKKEESQWSTPSETHTETPKPAENTQKAKKQVDSATILLGQLNLRTRLNNAQTPVRRREVKEDVVVPVEQKVEGVPTAPKSMRDKEGREGVGLGRASTKSAVEVKPAEAISQPVPIQQSKAEEPIARTSSIPSQATAAPSLDASPRKHRDWAEEDDEDDDDLGIEEWGYTNEQIMHRKVSPTISRKPSLPPPFQPREEEGSRWGRQPEAERRGRGGQGNANRLARLGMPVR